MKMLDLNEPRNFFRVGFDDLSTARLIEMADACHCDVNSIIVALVKGVLEDDAQAHQEPPLPTLTIQ